MSSVSRVIWPMRLCAMVTLFAACSRDEVTQPRLAGKSNDAVSTQDRKFLVHEADRIYLQEDPSGIVVSSQSPEIARIVADAFAGDQGVRIGASEPLSVRHHRLFSLSGATNAAVSRARSVLVKDPRIAFASAVYRTVDGNHPIVPVNQLDIRFSADVSEADIEATIRSVNARVIRPPFPDSGYFAYRIAYDVATDPFDVAALLSARAKVAWADPDRVANIAPAYVPTDPMYSQQFHLINSNTLFGVPVDINVEAAWNLTLGSASTRVTVIDDGIDLLHSNSGGGFAGDLVGRFGGGFAFDAVSAFATGDNALAPYGNDTHGTSVAGIIAANHNNGVGGAGIAPNVILNSVRIWRRTYPDGLGSTQQSATVAQIGDGINKAWQVMASDVISNSYQIFVPSATITSAIDNALTHGRGGKGTVVVYSAGNTSIRSIGSIGAVTYPASLSSTRAVISVSAIDRYGAVADYAPNGTIDVVAPSGQYTGGCFGEVITTDLYGSPGCSDGPGGAIDFTGTFSGTSAAAPQVAGVAALVLARYPTLTASQVKTRIRTTAASWGSSATFGAGKLDAFNAAW